MPPRTARTTRSKGAASADDASAAATTTASKYTLEPETANPPKLFILPKKATPEARIVTLPHPRYAAKPTRYLVCPETGVYEFTRIACPPTTPRSWLIASEGGKAVSGPEQNEAEPTEATEEEGLVAAQSESPSKPSSSRFEAHVTQSADLYLATVVDPLFLVLPALFSQPPSSSSSSSPTSSAPPKRMFLTADDHLDALPALADDASHLAPLLRHHPAVRALFEKRMAAVCDTVSAGDETMFRLNEDKLLLALLEKAQRASRALPASLADQFVARALEAPVLGGVRATTTTSITTNGSPSSTPAVSTPSTEMSLESAESQASLSTVDSAASFASDVSAASTAATSASGGDVDTAGGGDARAAMQAPDEAVALQRLRVAFDFVCARYVPPALAAALKARLADQAKSGVDFAPLDAYLAQLAKMRQEAAMARSAALDYAAGRAKRALDDEDDYDDRAEKRRKKEEEEKRKKAQESRGVRELKKVNVSGMKKLSEFFKKK